MDYALEQCNNGGWKARFPDDAVETVLDRVRRNEDLDVDTEHMLLWHRDDVKCSFVRSSGVMMLRTEDREEAESLAAHAVQAQS